MKNHFFLKWIIVSIFLLGFCLFIALILFNYAAILSLISGVIIVFIAERYFVFLAEIVQRIGQELKKIWASYLLIILLIFIILVSLFLSKHMPLVRPIIETYKITLSPFSNLKDFQVKEEIKFNRDLLVPRLKLKSKNNLSLYNKISTISGHQMHRQTNSINKGLILREVYIRPLNFDINGYFNLKLSNGISLRDKICKDICPKSKVELIDFPSGSFYQAQGAENLMLSYYLDTETVIWSIPNLERGIRFAYISPPYHHLRGFFNPFLKFAFTNKWIIVAIGGIIAFIFTPKFNQIINVENVATSESKSMSQSSKKESNFNLQDAQFGGGLVNADTVNAEQIGGNIANYGQQQQKEARTGTNNSAVKTILILASNPKNTSQLRLDEEVREIDAGLQRAKKRELFDLKQRWAVRVQDVYQALLDFKPQIVHFSGHGSGDDGLALEDDNGNLKLVDTEALAKLFELFSTTIECIVLNACYSEVQAQAIAKHIPYVIGMNQAIGDKAAVKFATGFYNALGSGESVEFAYKLGCNVIQLDGIPEHLTPVLIKKQ